MNIEGRRTACLLTPDLSNGKMNVKGCDMTDKANTSRNWRLEEIAQILANGIIRLKAGTVDSDKSLQSTEQKKKFC